MTTYLKENDVHSVSFKINMNLTGCTAKVLLKNRSAYDSPVQEFPATVSDPANGIVSWAYDGTLDAGAYATEIELTRGTDKVTAPTEGYYTVKVECDLDGA